MRVTNTQNQKTHDTRGAHSIIVVPRPLHAPLVWMTRRQLRIEMTLRLEHASLALGIFEPLSLSGRFRLGQ